MLASKATVGEGEKHMEAKHLKPVTAGFIFNCLLVQSMWRLQRRRRARATGCSSTWLTGAVGGTRPTEGEEGGFDNTPLISRKKNTHTLALKSDTEHVDSVSHTFLLWWFSAAEMFVFFYDCLILFLFTISKYANDFAERGGHMRER